MGEKGRKRDERKGETLMVSAFDEDEKDENRDNEVGQLVVCEIRKCFTVISLSSSLSSSSPAEAPQDGLDAKGILEVLKVYQLYFTIICHSRTSFECIIPAMVLL